MEQFHFQMLHIIQLSYRVLMLYSAIANVNVAFRDAGPTWFFAVRAHGKSVLEGWSTQCLRHTEAVLALLLQTSATNDDKNNLITIPDCVFDLIGFIASFLIACHFALFKAMGAELPGAAMALIVRIRDLLAPFEEGHSAKRCSRLMGILMESWEKRGAESLGRYGPYHGDPRSNRGKGETARSSSGSVPEMTPTLPQQYYDTQRLELSPPDSSGMQFSANRLVRMDNTASTPSTTPWMDETQASQYDTYDFWHQFMGTQGRI